MLQKRKGKKEKKHTISVVANIRVGKKVIMISWKTPHKVRNMSEDKQGIVFFLVIFWRISCKTLTHAKISFFYVDDENLCFSGLTTILQCYSGCLLCILVMKYCKLPGKVLPPTISIIC